MGRLIGLDVGGKRTGVATTDELRIICTPLETIPTEELGAFLQKLKSSNNFDGIVVGVPLLITGGQTDSTARIHKEVEKIKKTFPGMAIHLVDEGNTSKEALDIQLQGGMKKSKRREKGSLDAISASLILQRHLDAQQWGRISS